MYYVGKKFSVYVCVWGVGVELDQKYELRGNKCKLNKC